MKCIVPGPNVKVLGRAVHSLAKLGDELYLETTTRGLSFRTANSSKTAYATFQFSVNFFSFFASDKLECTKNFVKCQISMRSSLSVFRSPITLDRTVDSLQIQIYSNSDKLTFLMKYKKGFIKTFHVPVIECETLQAYYLKEKTPNRLIVQPKIVCDILSNFQSNQQEITWKVTKDNLFIRNYSENESGYSGVRTEITVEKGEFDEYNIENETEITFCLKELRAVLLFSDNVVLPLTASFINSGKPIIFTVKGDVFEADIVVSTLIGSDYVESQVSNHSQTEAKRNETVTGAEEFINNKNDEFLCNIDLNEKDILNTERNSAKNKIDEDSSDNKEKLKYVFQRCFENKEFDVKKLPGYDVILASDSDPDSEME